MASETQDPGAVEKKAGSVKKITPPKEKPRFSLVLAALGELLLEIILPALLAGGVLLWLFGGYNLWQMIGRTTALVIFAIVMVVFALLLAVVLDGAAAPFRSSKSMKPVRFVRDPRTRLVKLALGGLLLPLAVFAAANLVPLPTQGKVIDYFIAAAVPPVKLTPPDEVGTIAKNATNPATKLLSIQVLQGFQSPEALNQLVRLVRDDSSALADPAVADALAKAIAGYGITARDPLISVFKTSDSKQAGAATSGVTVAASPDLYARYFEQSFESLKGEITANTPDQAAREAQLAQVQAAQSQLKNNLGRMGYKAPKTVLADSRADPRQDFVLRTFMAMDLKEDADLLAFARATAADERYSSQVRGSALLLVGKLGEQKDLDLLYANLKSEDDLLLTRTLQAISALQAKLAAGGAK